MPALEIIDSRIADWKISLEDTIADHASSCMFVLGPPAEPPADLRLVGMVLERDGEIVETGAGAAVLGDPLLAIAWLAERIAGFGEALQPGDVVLAGAIAPSIPADAGRLVRARFSDGVGDVSVQFVE